MVVVPGGGMRRVLARYVGRPVRSVDGRSLGEVADVLADSRSGVVQWLVLRVAGIRPRYRALPVNLSIEVAGNLVSPTSRHTLLAGPRVHVGTSLTAREERRLRAHWTSH